ncbi:MAG: hypothetical protein U1F61_03880 [Opitutaceae bacterium]
MDNPFKLTRASDLDDEQILRLWVDPDNDLADRLRPSSQLPMIILGGKGSGKTHLMRYHSYAIQERLHGSANMGGVVSKCGYLAVYGRCSGLNADRFARKNFTEEQWQTLFAYYLELWIGQLILQTVRDFLHHSDLLGTFQESRLVDHINALFDRPLNPAPETLADFAAHLRSCQRELDLAVNNASFGPVRIPEICLSPGALIFGIPREVTKNVPFLKKTLFTLLIDEYEHLPERAQRYVNTLVRERENPVTFKIGARLYGFRTYSTFSGDEELREGSEYELLNLDDALRKKEDAYERFALNLCVSRIKFSAGNQFPDSWNETNSIERFLRLFEEPATIEDRVAKKLATKGIAPWIEDVRQSLEKFTGMSGGEIQNLVGKLRHPIPLIEKTNTFLLYRCWSRKENLAASGDTIVASANAFYSEKSKESEHWKVLDKFRDDMRAQMLEDLELPQQYLGVSTWIRMSNGIARNLVTTLKHVFDWAHFHQENVLAEGGISVRSQTKGVEAASEWFLNDARVLGRDLATVKSGLNRVSSLLRTLRFSQKPPECSLSTFEIDVENSRAEFTRILQLCEHWSLVIRVNDRLDRNSKANVLKYRISGMIAPKYDLPLYTRGSIHLSTPEAAVIFGGAPESEFTKITRARANRVNPPFRTSQEDSTDNSSSELRFL